ncbi:MAG TPA: DUF4199 domain-containing protein [Saprospiraceae bacterium]|nr:DUF4199 domain-containing protein [Saprospiraceae bacterium]HMP25457.1 DUF4199 domain-containing protein [Saprospiraceae bacterium]
MQNNIAAKYGIMAGVGVVAYFLLFYMANVRLFFSPFVAWGVLVVYIAAMAKAAADQRKLQGDFPFKDALRTAFLTFAIASLTYHVFVYLLYNVFDPELVEVQKEILFEQMTAMAKRFELTDLKEQIKDFASQDFRVTLRNSSMALGQSLIGGFILSLGIAALMRNQ